MKIEIKGIKKEQEEMKTEIKKISNTQSKILEELRINNLKLSKVAERLEESISENREEHKIFDSRITRLEAKVG